MGTCESQPHCYFVPNITSMMGPLLPSYVSLLNALNTQLLREHVLNTHQQYMFVHMLIIILQHSRSHHERRTNCQGYPHVSMYYTLFASIIFVSPHCNHALNIIHQNGKKIYEKIPQFLHNIFDMLLKCFHCRPLNIQLGLDSKFTVSLDKSLIKCHLHPHVKHNPPTLVRIVDLTNIYMRNVLFKVTLLDTLTKFVLAQ